MTDQVTISFTLSRDQAWAMAEVIKRLAVRDLGPADLRLANPHQPDEQDQAEDAFLRLERALAEAGFAPR
jgi:hypothetical protein